MSQKLSKAMAINRLKEIQRKNSQDGERNSEESLSVLLAYLKDNKGRAVAEAFESVKENTKFY
jgi:hypothetical protein